MMYENAEEAIARILTIVDKCPNSLKEKCFEVLLRGYVERELSEFSGRTPNAILQPLGAKIGEESLGIPEAVLPRFRAAANRLSIELASLAGLFDFGNDPFTFHALTVDGKGNADKTRKVALLVAAKSYLTTGNWVADWQEVKAECVNQNCYDQTNLKHFLEKGVGAAWFKSIEVGKSIELSAEGVKEAQMSLAIQAQAR
jgi:hypothetical protein